MAETNIRLLTAAEAADRLRKNPWWVTGECRSGRLRASRYGGTWHIPEDAITEYVAEHTNKPAPTVTTRRRKQRSA